MLKKATLILAYLALIFSAKPGHAVCVAPVVGASLPGLSVPLIGTAPSGPTLTSHSYTLGGGVLIESRIIESIRVEWGGLYMPRGFVVSDTAIQNTFYTLQFPILLKFYAGRSFFFGLGSYFIHSMGNIYLTPVSDPAALSYQSYEDAKLSRDDYGLLVSMGFKIKLVRGTHLLLDFRYLHGLRDLSDAPGVDISLKDVQALVGLSFGT